MWRHLPNDKMLITLTKGKQNVEAPNPQAEFTPLRNIGEDSSYSHVFTLPRETQATYASPSLPISSYPYPYEPS